MATNFFLTILDDMIESTEELVLVADDLYGAANGNKAIVDMMIRDELVAPMVRDLQALEHVRKLYTLSFQED